MRHLRSDYDAIQPFPVKRSHVVKVDGETVDANRESPEHLSVLGRHMEPLIPDDEPVFLLRGQDPIAAEVVKTYAFILELRGGDQHVAQRIQEWAEYMKKYAEEKQHGLPDVPPGALRPAPF